VLIYVEYITERLLYTLSFVFGDRKIAYQITNDGIAFIAAKGPKLNYSKREFEDCFQLLPAAVLFEDELQKEVPQKSTYRDISCLAFQQIPDVLASVFYVLSRMEEYNSLHQDGLGRYKAAASILQKQDWLQTPICDVWSNALIALLEKEWQISLNAQQPRFYFQPTFDIDNTFAFAHKNTIRTFLANAKDLIYGRSARRNDRKMVRQGRSKDPYDTFEQIAALAQHFQDTKVFWLLGNYTKLDKNISHLNLAQQEKIKEIAAFAEIGIHGSSLTPFNAQQLEIEIQRLTQIIGYRPNSNRQHFLLLHLPETYRNLLKAGITHDYTMGYAEQTGFRAGTARSFKWFDLQKNEVTNLNIHPFVYMDGTLLEYLKLSPSEAKVRIAALYHAVQKYGGAFSFLWHNETISGYQHWESYQEVFKENFVLNAAKGNVN
jgi:hypothetical protein